MQRSRWVPRFIASASLVASIPLAPGVARAQQPAPPGEAPAAPAAPAAPLPAAPGGGDTPVAPPPAGAEAPVAPPAVAETPVAAPPAGGDTPGAAPAAAKPPPPPYSLPWQLRPVVVGNVVRSDTAFALRNAPTGDTATTVVPMFLVSYKVTPEIAPFVRLAVVHHAPPGEAESGTSFINPVVGGMYALKPSPATRLAFTLAFTIPVGTGGGDEPDKATQAANTAGVLARSAFDNAMFAVNDFTPIAGVGLAYVDHGFTAQIEATFFPLIRVRGAMAQKDEFKLNFTSGLHAGYFFNPHVSIGTELRAQVFFTTPAAVELADNLRHTFTLAIGPRFHFKLGESTWVRPGVSVARGLDKPMTAQNLSVIQLDIPVAF